MKHPLFPLKRWRARLGWITDFQPERNGALFGVARISTLEKDLAPPTLLELGFIDNDPRLASVPIAGRLNLG